MSGRKYDSLGKVGKTAVDSDLKIDNRPKIFRTNNQRARINTLYILLPPPHALVPIQVVLYEVLQQHCTLMLPRLADTTLGKLLKGSLMTRLARMLALSNSPFYNGSQYRGIWPGRKGFLLWCWDFCRVLPAKPRLCHNILLRTDVDYRLPCKRSE